MARFLEDWSKTSTIPNFSQIITLRLIWKKRGKNSKPQLISEIILIPTTLKLSFGTFQHLEPIPESINSTLSTSECAIYICAHNHHQSFLIDGWLLCNII